jgi:uncharacterized membrane protein
MALDTTNVKSILTSKTFYGAVLALISVVAPHLYQHILAAFGVNDPNQIANMIVGTLGSILAIYGRFVATQTVTLTGAPKK